MLHGEIKSITIYARLDRYSISARGINMVAERTAAYRIMDLEETDRPRERLAELGAQALTNAELIAILLRTGMAGENAVEIGQRLLQSFGGLPGLHSAAFAELCAERGLGPAKAAQIKAAIELGKRLAAANSG